MAVQERVGSILNEVCTVVQQRSLFGTDQPASPAQAVDLIFEEVMDLGEDVTPATNICPVAGGTELSVSTLKIIMEKAPDFKRDHY